MALRDRLARWLNAELLGVVFVKIYYENSRLIFWVFIAALFLVCSNMVSCSAGRQGAFHDMNRTDLAWENHKLNEQIKQYVKDKE